MKNISKEEQTEKVHGIVVKLANAKQTNWIAEGFTDEEVKEIIESARADVRDSFKKNKTER